jgi:hypothetical protein
MFGDDVMGRLADDGVLACPAPLFEPRPSLCACSSPSRGRTGGRRGRRRPASCAGLELPLGRTAGKHLALRFVEAGFVDRHVEVELLGTVGGWPLRRLAIGDRPPRAVDQPSVPRRATNPTGGLEPRGRVPGCRPRRFTLPHG